MNNYMCVEKRAVYLSLIVIVLLIASFYAVRIMEESQTIKSQAQIECGSLGKPVCTKNNNKRNTSLTTACNKGLVMTVKDRRTICTFPNKPAGKIIKKIK